jgi:hypothetical protein
MVEARIRQLDARIQELEPAHQVRLLRLYLCSFSERYCVHQAAGCEHPKARLYSTGESNFSAATCVDFFDASCLPLPQLRHHAATACTMLLQQQCFLGHSMPFSAGVSNLGAQQCNTRRPKHRFCRSPAALNQTFIDCDCSRYCCCCRGRVSDTRVLSKIGGHTAGSWQVFVKQAMPDRLSLPLPLQARSQSKERSWMLSCSESYLTYVCLTVALTVFATASAGLEARPTCSV